MAVPESSYGDKLENQNFLTYDRGLNHYRSSSNINPTNMPLSDNGSVGQVAMT